MGDELNYVKKRTQLCISPAPHTLKASCCRTDPNMLCGLVTWCDSRIAPQNGEMHSLLCCDTFGSDVCCWKGV